MFKKNIKNLINKFPYINSLYMENIRLRKTSKFPAGHFYSPIVSIDEVKQNENKIWSSEAPSEILGIELNVLFQLSLIENFALYYAELPFNETKADNRRYYYKNKFYSYTDGIMLYSMVRHYKPKRIIEIGSGFSSALMMDTNELFFSNSIDITFVEPYPNRLKSLMGNDDPRQYSIIEDNVQNLNISLFQSLKKGDILFVDSSHVSKTGSDVNFILFNILPILDKGVLIHFHDIFYPFEYPKKWVYDGFNWNETYLVRAFLMNNDSFEIILWSDYLHQKHKNFFHQMPLTLKNTGGNLWIEKK